MKSPIKAILRRHWDQKKELNMNKKILFLIALMSNVYIESLISMHILARRATHSSSSKISSQRFCTTQYNPSSSSDVMYVYNTHQQTVTIDNCEYAIDEKVSHQILKEEPCTDGESEFLVRKNQYSRVGIPWACLGFYIEKRKTQSTTKTLPYLSKMGAQSILFSIADDKEVKKTFAEITNDGNHNNTIRLLQRLEDYLKDAHHGYKPRINPIQVGQVKDAFKCCLCAIPPLLITAAPIIGYYTEDVTWAMLSFIGGIHPITLLGCVVIPNMQEHPSARDSILSLLHGQDKDTKQKVMQQFFALADDLYREGKKNSSYSHE
jgi:hypothetical protein